MLKSELAFFSIMLLQGKCACLLINSVSIRIYSYVGELCVVLLNYEYVGVGTYRCFTVFSVIILVDRYCGSYDRHCTIYYFLCQSTYFTICRVLLYELELV